MNLSKIRSEAKTGKTALPYFFKGGKTAILAVHGYNGYSRDLLYIGKILNKKGFTVLIPRLPGHGTDSDDFLESGCNDWLRHVLDCYLNLKSRYEKVYFLGFSMGGLLTLLLASKFKIDRMALISPAIINLKWTIKLTPILKFFIKKQKRDWNEKTADPDRIFLAHEYWHWHYIKTGAELLKLQNYTKKRLSLVTSDTMIIVSEKDEAVPVIAAEYISNRISSTVKKIVILKNSPHCSTDGPEKKVIAEILVKWFKEKK